MKLKTKILLPAISALVTGGAIIFFFIYYYMQENFYNTLNDNIAGKKISMARNLEFLSKSASYIAGICAGIDFVENAYQNYYTTNDIKSSYDILNANFEKIQNILEKTVNYNPAQIHFHLPPATSFYRSWTDKKIGEDLSSFRQTVLKANIDKTVVSGIEVGRGGMVIRSIVPIKSKDNKHLGSVEALFDIKELVNMLRSDNKEQFAILLHKDYADKSLNDSGKIKALDDYFFYTLFAIKTSR